MSKAKDYKGAGIYGLYNIMEGTLYIGASANIQTRFAQHRSRFRSRSEINPMYKEPVENFVFVVLYKMSKPDFEKYGTMFEDLLIASAVRDNMKLYNQNKVYRDATGSVLFAFGIYDAIKKSIQSEVGRTPWMLNMMNRKSRLKVLERIRKGC